MPLRDHFRPPVSDRSSWEAVHGGWPMVIVQQLVRTLPEQYIAEPRVHLGSEFEVDVVTNKSFDLYAQLLEWVGGHDASLGEVPPPHTPQPAAGGRWGRA